MVGETDQHDRLTHGVLQQNAVAALQLGRGYSLLPVVLIPDQKSYGLEIDGRAGRPLGLQNVVP